MTPSRRLQRNSLQTILLPLFGILVLIFLALMAIKAYVASTPRSSETFSIEEGAELPEFTLSQINGGPVSISTVPGKVYLVNFWATWCEACMEEMPSMVRLWEKYKSQGFEVIGINLDENPEAVVPRTVKQLNIGFPIFKDPEGKVAELFDVHAIPLTVVMNHKRKILFVKNGEQNWDSPEIHTKVMRWLAK